MAINMSNNPMIQHHQAERPTFGQLFNEQSQLVTATRLYHSTTSRQMVEREPKDFEALGEGMPQSDKEAMHLKLLAYYVLPGPWENGKCLKRPFRYCGSESASPKVWASRAFSVCDAY